MKLGLGCKNRHVSQYNDTQHNDIQHNDTQHKGLTCGTQQKELTCDTQHKRHSALQSSAIM